MSEVVVRSLGEDLRQQVRAGQHQVVVDEPADAGGSDAGPTPYDLLLGALGACTAMTLRLYARRKGWPLEGVEVALHHERAHARDCEDCERSESRLDVVRKRLTLRGRLDAEQRQRLAEIAERCPVQRTLAGTVRVEQTLEPAAGAD